MSQKRGEQNCLRQYLCSRIIPFTMEWNSSLLYQHVNFCWWFYLLPFVLVLFVLCASKRKAIFCLFFQFLRIYIPARKSSFFGASDEQQDIVECCDKEQIEFLLLNFSFEDLLSSTVRLKLSCFIQKTFIFRTLLKSSCNNCHRKKLKEIK